MKTKITTHDIYFAAALLTFGCTIENTDRSDPKHIKFTVAIKNAHYVNFSSENIPAVELVDPVGIDKYENMWFEGTLQVNAVAFKHSFQYMQSLIHSS